MGEGSLRCSLYLSPKALQVLPMYSSYILSTSPLRVLAFGKGLPEVLYFLIKEIWLSANSPSPVGKGSNDTVFGN